ncbi:MAG: 12-oxophytodienoate reductase [Gammaproteobacteria bacterium]|nr:12-oxophytodienoate reductase [Gammaproteobacteria bacterium]
MSNAYSPLFTPIQLNGTCLRNRIVMAPMTRSFCGQEGVPGADVAAYYAARAEGGVGLIVTEGVVVNMADARGYGGVPGLANAAQVEGWKEVVTGVHQHDGAIAPQLWHAGRLAHSRATGGLQPVAPSAIRASGAYMDVADPSTLTGEIPYEVPKALTEAEIEAIIQQFGEAAVRSKEAGFDAIELHGASGYLIHQFMNPESNRRSDDYGGDVERRAEFAARIVQAIRAAVGPDLPVIMRLAQFAINDFEWQTWANPDELECTVKRLVAAGVSLFHASSHRLNTPAFPWLHGANGRSLSSYIKEFSGCPTIAVGGVSYSATVFESLGGGTCAVTDPIDAAAMIEAGDADLIAIGRALISNPDWCRKVEAGEWRSLLPFGREALMSLD